MKLDIKYFKEILEMIETNESSLCSLGDIITTLGIEDGDNPTLDKLRGHLELLHGSGLLTSSNTNCGFTPMQNPAVANPNVNNIFAMTLAGHKLLEENRDRDWLADIKDILDIIGKIIMLRNML